MLVLCGCDRSRALTAACAPLRAPRNAISVVAWNNIMRCVSVCVGFWSGLALLYGAWNCHSSVHEVLESDTHPAIAQYQQVDDLLVAALRTRNDQRDF